MQVMSKDERYAVVAKTTSGRRRTPGLRLAAGGAVLALLVLGLGVVMHGNASFAENYLSTQLSEQRITFPSAEALAPEERTTTCLVHNAGKPLTTGKQAECYANHFIGRHLKKIAGGKTYAEMRTVMTSLESQIAEAQTRNDPAVADLQRRLAAATGQRRTLLEGETVRGMLLTSFGFGNLGQKAGQATSVAYVAAGSLLLASVVVLAVGLGSGRRRGVTASR